MTESCMDPEMDKSGTAAMLRVDDDEAKGKVAPTVVRFNRQGRQTRVRPVVTNTGGELLLRVTPETIAEVLLAPVKASSDQKRAGYACVHCELRDCSILRDRDSLVVCDAGQETVFVLAQVDEAVQLFLQAFHRRN